jgi:UDP-N-acetylmuramoyl-tripeptide--D-alanyl-D-alanine ligase
MKNIFKKVITSILLWESKIILKKYNPYVISITGSVGKTSTKDAIFTALSTSDYVRRSDKSFNSEIGIPLTIIGCDNGWSDPIAWLSNIFQGLELIVFKSDYPKILVLEVGADHPHDIESVSKWLQSDIVVMNKVGDIPVHVEFFASAEEVLKEKSFLIKTLKPNGTLVLFSDDKKVSNLAQGVKQTVMTFGINEMATVTASNISAFYNDDKTPEGMSFRINHKGNSIPMKIIGTLGSQQIYPIIAAITVGIAKGIAIPKLIDAFDKHSAPKGRMNILKGMNDSTIIDDTYNASPDALREGLTALASLQVSGKRIAVIGDMMELGNFSAEEHRKAGIQAIQSSDVLVTVGPRAKVMSDKAIAFNNSTDAGEYLKTIISQGDVIYVKGSQSMRMERAVKMILNDPSLAPKLLVRQEKEWLEKK